MSRRQVPYPRFEPTPHPAAHPHRRRAGGRRRTCVRRKTGAVAFDLIDKYVGILLDVDLSGVPRGATVVMESPRRLRRELSYGYVHALWWVWLDDGRSVISVPPGSGRNISQLVDGIQDSGAVLNANLAARLQVPINSALETAGLPHTDRALFDLVFACNGELLRSQASTLCQRISDPAIPVAAGIHVPAQCIADGAVFGRVVDGTVVSAAYAHRSGVMQDRIADIGVETALNYRRQGFGKSAVSALVGDFTKRGGEARYGCSPKNVASIATAKAVGFVPYAKSMILSARHGKEGISK